MEGMTPERIAELEAQLNERHFFQDVFCRTNQGAAVLSLILNRCGYFASDPASVAPELIAFANWLLWNTGIWAYPGNGDHLIKQIGMLASGSTDSDIPKPKEADE